jgi:hypothetical protein
MVVRERRRRCEANGEPFEELLALLPGSKLRSIAEILRYGRQRVYEWNLAVRALSAGTEEIEPILEITPRPITSSSREELSSHLGWSRIAIETLCRGLNGARTLYATTQP